MHSSKSSKDLSALGRSAVSVSDNPSEARVNAFYEAHDESASFVVPQAMNRKHILMKRAMASNHRFYDHWNDQLPKVKSEYMTKKHPQSMQIVTNSTSTKKLPRQSTMVEHQKFRERPRIVPVQVPEKLEKEETGSQYQTRIQSRRKASAKVPNTSRAKAYSTWKTRNAQMKSSGLSRDGLNMDVKDDLRQNPVGQIIINNLNISYGNVYIMQNTPEDSK